MLFPPWDQVVYPLWWPSLTKYMQTEQLLCWSGMTDTKHTTSGSNEEEDDNRFSFSFVYKTNQQHLCCSSV